MHIKGGLNIYIKNCCNINIALKHSIYFISFIGLCQGKTKLKIKFHSRAFIY